MQAMMEAQELARRFNDAEMIWRVFENKRSWRRLLGSGTPLPEETLDWLDWQAAEQECRATRAVGFFHP